MLQDAQFLFRPCWAYHMGPLSLGKGNKVETSLMLQASSKTFMLVVLGLFFLPNPSLLCSLCSHACSPPTARNKCQRHVKAITLQH